MEPTVKQARIAGALYLSLGLFGPFSLLYVPNKTIVRGDAAATAAKVLGLETLFRAGIVADLVGSILFLLVGLALYRLFAGVDKAHAHAMAFMVAISAALSFMNAVNNLAALTLFRGGGFLSVFDKRQLEAMGMFFINLHGKGIVVNEMLWGLWLIPFGVLVIRSGFIPKLLGILLLINGVAYIAISMTSLLRPEAGPIVQKFAFPALLGEIWIMLWLVIKGVRFRTPAVDHHRSTSHSRGAATSE